MPPTQEEEFELVLGNRQLLSLFFLAVVLFAVFFSFGYMIGFGRGQQDRVATIAAAAPAEQPQDEVRLPDTLLEEAPQPPDPRAKVEPVAATSRPAPIPAQAEREVVTNRAPAKPAPKQAPPKKEPAATRPPAQPTSGHAVARAIHLQVAALRMKADAHLLVDKLKDKGYRVALYDQGDGWLRVLVGPYNDEASAKADQKRLSTDGLDSLLRRP